MKKLLLLLLLAGNFHYSQNRIYFDSSWVEPTKDHAVYYREIEKKGNLTLIKDFYKNGTLQMDGLASNATTNEEIFEGKVTWYYPNGKVQSFANYKNGNYIGETKGYDEDGKLNTDFVYDDKGNFSGKQYTNKNIANGIDYNAVSEYKKSALLKTIIFDENPKGIRSETEYTNSYNVKETRSYDENGKLIGILKYNADYTYGDNSTMVDYFYNPMRIASITKYGKGEDILEKKEFHKNGKLKTEHKTTGDAAKSVYYNNSGAKIGDLVYKKTKNTYATEDSDTYLAAYDGKELIYFDAANKEDQIYQEKIYEKGNLISEKTYRENGSTKSLTEYVKNSGNGYYDYPTILKITYYNENSTVKSNLDYQDGLPYNGIAHEDDGEAEYKNGVLISEKKFDANKILRVERKPVKDDLYEIKVYDENKKLKYYYTYKHDDSYSFNATVKSYTTGKEETAVFEDGIITKGKIRYKDQYGDKVIELERSGDWIIKRTYDEKKALIKETKEKVNNEEYYGENRFYEELLTFFSNYNADDAIKILDSIVAPPALKQ